MNATDFNAVTYDGAVYCNTCLPSEVTIDSEGVSPIFAGSEWDCYPTCDACHAEHDYVSLTTEGRRERDERLARKHNMEIWREAILVVACDECGEYELPADAVHANAYRRELDGERVAKCPDCGGACAFPARSGRAGWFYWCCSPGCLPESEASGPYDSYGEALTAAVDGLE
jgi:hypothetical protein